MLLHFALVFVSATAVVAKAAPGLADHDIVGRYAHFDVVAYDDAQPFGNMATQVITYGFTDLTATDDGVIETDTFCHAEHRSNLPITTSVADAFTRAIVPRSTLVRVTNEGGERRIWRPETPTGLGIKLANPATDALPEAADDPRISDDDHDGHPGVSVAIDFGLFKGTLYLARREIFAYDMVLVAPGRLVGVVHDRSEQLTLGADPAFLAGKHAPTQNPDLSKSPIVLKKLDGLYDCSRLMAERDRHFPEVPPL